ncbi:unnamed protein product [Lupinus luteus]|uniref:Uncharacterized protein n=1 Tax=Lupinus luteus TaxID=3873 RepID=A0AAV1X7Q1_LUPLU
MAMDVSLKITQLELDELILYKPILKDNSIRKFVTSLHPFIIVGSFCRMYVFLAQKSGPLSLRSTPVTALISAQLATFAADQLVDYPTWDHDPPNHVERKMRGEEGCGTTVSGQSGSTSKSAGFPSSQSDQALVATSGDSTFLRLNHLDLHVDDAGS